MQRRWHPTRAAVRGPMLALVALLCTGPAMAHAQSTAKPEQAKMMPNDADPDWEVATVKPSDPNEENPAIRVQGRHLVIRKQNVETILMAGYGVQKNQIADAPDWVRKDTFDVDGVADLEGQPNVQQFQS